MRTAFAIIGVFVLVGCLYGADMKPSTQPSLENTQWNLIQLKGRELVDNARPHITLNSEKLSFEGSGGVNAISGTYALNGQQLRFTLGIQTHMARAGDANAQEREFLHALAAVDTYRIQDGKLELLVDDQVAARFQAK